MLTPMLRWVIVCMCSWLPAAELVRESSTAAVGVIVQWRLDGAAPGWLQADCALTPRLAIEAPDRSSVVRAAFIDADHVHFIGDDGSGFRRSGALTLRFRHTPRMAGTHRITVLSATGARIADAAIDVASAIAPGPVRISRSNPRLLAFNDGTPFIPIGPNIAWAEGPDRAARLAGFFAKAGANGCTHARLWLASWSGQIESARDAADPWRLDHAWLIDHALAAARASGMRVTLVLDNHYDREHGTLGDHGASPELRARAIITPMLAPAWARMVRYQIARWGADDTVAAWEPMNEPDLLQPDLQRTLPWSKAAAGLIRSLDPDRRLITMGWAGDDAPRTARDAGVDLVQPHAYILAFSADDDAARREADDVVGWLTARARGLDAGNRPWWFGEVGFQSTADRGIPGEDLDRDGFAVLQLAWSGWLLGGAGPASHWWWDRHIDHRGLWRLWRGQAAVANALDWRDPTLIPMAPGAGAIRVLGWRGRAQAVVWFNAQPDTWRRALIDGESRPLPPPETAATIHGFAAGTYRLRRFHWETGAVLADDAISVERSGDLVISVGAWADAIHVVTAR